MLKKRFKARMGAIALAAAMAFTAFSPAMPGDIAYAEENVTEEVTEVLTEKTEETEEVTEEVAEEATDEETVKDTDVIVEDSETTEKVIDFFKDDVELTVGADNAVDNEDDFITISGNIIGYEYKAPFEILFDTWGSNSNEKPAISTIAKDGKYSAKIRKNYDYIVRLPGADGYCLYDDNNEGVYIFTAEEDIECDIKIQMCKFDIDGEVDFDVLSDIAGESDEWDEICEGSVITIEGKTLEDDDYFYEETLEYGSYGEVMPVGEYVLTLKGKTGNVYSVEPLSLHQRSNGYVDVDDYTEYVMDYTSPYYGDYRTRDNEARIVCNFGDLQGADISNATFYFVDSDNNRTNGCSYLELKYGLIRLPKDKTYRLVAEGLPEGIELDYSKMSDICPAQEHCGDGRYSYDAVLGAESVQKPLAIVNDTEDITVTRNGIKCVFKLEAEGTDLKYCWYYKTPSMSTFKKAGALTNEYARHSTKYIDGMQVYCVVTDGNGNKLVGRTATLNIDYPAPVLTYPKGKVLKTTKGSKIYFSVSAKSDLPVTYSWYYMVPNAKGDGTFHKACCYEDTYIRHATKNIDGMKAYCVVTDSKGQKTKSDVITFKLK